MKCAFGGIFGFEMGRPKCRRGGCVGGGASEMKKTKCKKKKLLFGGRIWLEDVDFVKI